MAAPAEVREELGAYYAALHRGAVADRVRGAVPCLWFDEGTRRCRHYEWRPDACREFEVGDEDCLGVRQAGGLSSGSGSGGE